MAVIVTGFGFVTTIQEVRHFRLVALE